MTGKDEREGLIQKIAEATRSFGNTKKYIAPMLDKLVPAGNLESDSIRRAVEQLSEEVEAQGGQLTYEDSRQALRTYRETPAWAWDLFPFTQLYDSLALGGDERLALLERHRDNPKGLKKRDIRPLKGSKQDNPMSKKASTEEKLAGGFGLLQELLQRGDREAVLSFVAKHPEIRSLVDTLSLGVLALDGASRDATTRVPRDPEWESGDRLAEDIARATRLIRQRLTHVAGAVGPTTPRTRIVQEADQLIDLLGWVKSVMEGLSAEEFLSTLNEE